MPFYKHYPIDSLLVLREGYLYFHNGLRESSTLSTLMFILDNLGSHHTAIHKRTICIARSACGQLCSLLRPRYNSFRMRELARSITTLPKEAR